MPVPCFNAFGVTLSIKQCDRIPEGQWENDKISFQISEGIGSR